MVMIMGRFSTLISILIISAGLVSCQEDIWETVNNLDPIVVLYKITTGSVNTGPETTDPEVTIERRFVAVGDIGSSYTTDSAVTWNYNAHSSGMMYGVIYGNGIFVGVGTANNAIYSTDGTTWANANHGAWNIYGITYGNNRFVIVGDLPVSASYSLDGMSWNPPTASPGVSMNAVAYGNGRFYAVGNAGSASYSTDNGDSWIASTTGGANMTVIAFGNGSFVALGANVAAYSTDSGDTWNPATVPSGSADYKAVTYGNGHFVAVGPVFPPDGNGVISYSTNDGQDWTTLNQGANIYHGVAYGYDSNGNGLFIAVGPAGKAIYSADGENWIIADHNNGNMEEICYGEWTP